jgi:hypothetical protein
MVSIRTTQGATSATARRMAVSWSVFKSVCAKTRDSAPISTTLSSQTANNKDWRKIFFAFFASAA